MPPNHASLYLIPTPISDQSPLEILPPYTLEVLDKCDVFIVEKIRTARRFLRSAGVKRSMSEITFFELNEHTLPEHISEFLLPLSKEHKDIGLMSEAGLPCIADPGAQIAAIAQRLKIDIVPLVGPSSLLMALMASGFNGQNFAFVGYLPIDKSGVSGRIRELESLVWKYGQTQMFIEAPYRNNQLLKQIVEVCNPRTSLCIATQILEQKQSIRTKTIAEWRKECPDLHKKNTVFILGQ